MKEKRSRIARNGRIVIPAAFRRALGVDGGGEVILVLDGAEVRILAPEEAVRRAQELVMLHSRGGKRRLAEELLRERRAETRGG